MVSGSGFTVNIGTGGVLFQTQDCLPCGVGIQLSLAWPGRPGDYPATKVQVSGVTVRTEADRTAVRICSYEFVTTLGRPS